nr:hypothetical protein BaRGS_007308 [Batillaria attramentaria]
MAEASGVKASRFRRAATLQSVISYAVVMSERSSIGCVSSCSRYSHCNTCAFDGESGTCYIQPVIANGLVGKFAVYVDKMVNGKRKTLTEIAYRGLGGNPRFVINFLDSFSGYIFHFDNRLNYATIYQTTVLDSNVNGVWGQNRQFVTPRPFPFIKGQQFHVSFTAVDMYTLEVDVNGERYATYTGTPAALDTVAGVETVMDVRIKELHLCIHTLGRSWWPAFLSAP